jgi:SET domain-containing protein
MNKKVTAKRSKIDRVGLFAAQNFSKGESVYKLRGKKVSIGEIENIFRKGLNRISADGFQISDTEYIFLNKTSDYINHSCDPNCGIRGESELVALRDIEAGSELTYDYSAAEWTPSHYTAYDYTEWPMLCRCKSPNCRGLITCFPYLPQELKSKYISSGIIPNHIIEKLSNPFHSTGCRVCEERLQ